MSLWSLLIIMIVTCSWFLWKRKQCVGMTQVYVVDPPQPSLLLVKRGSVYVATPSEFANL